MEQNYGHYVGITGITGNYGITGTPYQLRNC